MSAFTLKNRVQGGKTPELTEWGMNSEYGVLRDVLLGPPDNYTWLESNAVAKRSVRLGFKFERDVALEQHAQMRACYQEAGVTVHMLEPEPHLPYQIYARDSSVMTPWGAIVSQMSNHWRRGEYAEIIRFYHRNDIPIYDMVSSGTFEGGDFHVIKPGVILCGYSEDRTESAAIAQLRNWFEAEGWELYAYQFDPFFLHADVFFAMLAEGLAAVCTDVVEPEFIDWVHAKGIEIIDIPFKDAMNNMGCNVVSLGNDRVMLPKQAIQLKVKCEAHGLYVYSPDISMIAKGGGSLHCMCQPLRRDPVKA